MGDSIQENAQRSRLISAIIAVVVAGGILGLFLFDISRPRGEVDGVGYAALVALSVRFGNRTLIGCAVLTTLLTLIGSQLVPDAGISVAGMWANRGFAIAEIWIIATLLVNRLSLEAFIQGREAALRSQQSALSRIVREALLSNRSFEECLRRVTELSGAELGCEYTAILQGNDKTKLVRVLDAWRRSTAIHIPVPDQPLTQMPTYNARMRDDLVVLADDVLQSPYHAERLDFFKEIGVRAILVADIFTDRPGQGAVAFAHEQPHHWSEEEIAFARAVAGVVALLLAANRSLETFAALDLVSEGIYAETSEGVVQYANRAAREFAGGDGAIENLDYPRPPMPLAGSRDFHEIAFKGRDLEIERARLDNGGVVTRINDVSERNAAIAERRRLRARVQQSEKMEAIGQLAGGVAHDFNNILGAIRGFAGFLVQDLPERSAERGFADRIVAACDRGKDLVEQILAFARAKTVERGVVDLGILIKRNRDYLGTLLPEPIALRLDIEDRPLPVVGSGVQMSQLITNLCVNARDALEGREAGTVEIVARQATAADMARLKSAAPGAEERIFGEAKPSAAYCLLCISDDGPGIAPAILDRIFEPFFTTKGRHRGTGLGLAVAHGVVESTGGVCHVRTAPGRGTVFSVFFPLASGTTSEARAPNEARDPRGGERVLIVDDERDIADMMAIGLERLGYETVGVNDPLEALSAFAEDPKAFDIVVTDQVMPGLRGLDLIRKLKEIKPEIRTVLCTGYSDGANEQVALAAGADAFFHKPVDARQLAPTLRILMEGG